MRFQNLSGATVVWTARPEEAGLALRAGLPDPALDPPVAVFLAEEAFVSVVTLTRLSGGRLRPEKRRVRLPRTG
ncbi:hypothetical protein [Streptomyces sp. VNUA24]|uniref:hypothetical protein n=1 Tax=Streptomyces sp. VNUA24 TaxID=3031131 RepID=UPI0023B866E6|nr:hypothetical protein [Streptomyces sp. VNUA24]WEH20487.1 hypothetical protein PYR72_04770 [Streptomyces sp. VNUA24]